MELEDVFCSKTRIKILKLLLANEQLNTTQIAERVGANYETVHKHLETLEAEGILEMQPFGSRIRFYRFNEKSRKARAAQMLLQAWKP